MYKDEKKVMNYNIDLFFNWTLL